MASGLPVVAVRASGIEEIVSDGVSGLLVPEDAAALARAVDQILADDHLGAKLGMGAREDASLRIVGAGRAAGRRVPASQGRAGVELRRDDLARAAGDRDQSRAERLGGTERDIRQAQAEALGRTGERLQRILDELAALDRRLDELGEAGKGPTEADLIGSETAIRNRVRDEAARIRHHLIIQREALGFARPPRRAMLPCTRAPAPSRTGRPSREGAMTEERERHARLLAQIGPARRSRARTR